ncbi:MAG: ABC transporter substrate-binding protein [Alphaproteobacteria bacterium]|nr:ABC transporter substrate-binding protein [Alphaproteobacteria bacterium]
MRTTRRRLLGTGLAASLPITAGALPAFASASDNIIRFGLSVEKPASLDPAFGIQGADNTVTRQIFDAFIDPPYGTFNLDPKGMIGEAVEAWEMAADSRSVTLKLREGMLFHKGYGEVTADDAKFTFDRLRDPAGGSQYRVFYAGVEDITVLDKYRIRITLKRPDPTFYATSLIARGAMLVSRKAVEALGQGFRRTPVGSGPFEFVSYDNERGVVLKPFADYHGQKPQVAGIEFRYVPDSTARTLGFLKGQLDLIEGIRLPGWLDEVRGQAPKAQFDFTRPGSQNIIAFNLTRKPFDDIRVRRAIRFAIDRKVFQQAYGELYGDIWAINPPEYPGAFQKGQLPGDLQYDYNPTKAKQLLAEAGYPKGLSFETYISQREDYQAVMIMIQEMLRAVGIDMQLRTVDHTAYHTDNLRDQNIFGMNSETTAPVGTSLLQTYFSSANEVRKDGKGGRNYSHYGAAMPGIDAELARILDEPDLVRRQALTREAEVKILGDLPAFNALSLHWVFARNPRLDLGYKINASYAYFTLARARFVP